ncbi:heparinase II/III family protein [Methanocella paludicola]|nr:heparinase II/III family protein [Methanocella paludicola]
MSSANTALSKDFTRPDWGTYDSYDDGWISARGQYAMNLALAYQITKKTSYADKAKEALLNIDIARMPDSTVLMTPEGFKAIGLYSYCLAYDWVQPTLDPDSDRKIRDELAKLADSVYIDLNSSAADDGLNYKDNIYFYDFHGQAYPIMGIAGLTLNDFTNPDNLLLSSTPADWIKVGTDDFFVNDKLHDFGRSMISFGFDNSGQDLFGAYKSYYTDDLVLWAQVYSHYYSRNMFDVYPIAKLALTSELWDSLPNYYGNDFVTNGNIKYDYHRGIINLLDANNRSFALNFDDYVDSSNTLPYSFVDNHIYYGTKPLPSALLYTVYGDYSSVQRKTPPWTSHLSPDSVYQVFRGSWDTDSDWLALITWNVFTGANRDMSHQDQLSFEYYGKGDLLLADGGEDINVLDHYQGRYEVYHNTIAIEDPRNPYPPSPWADSTARGIFKGYYYLNTTATINDLFSTPWMEAVNAGATIKDVANMVGSDADNMELSSPIEYERMVLYPHRDYFIVVDRMEGSQAWGYRNIFRPTSLSIVPSTGTSESQVGHVKGSLAIDNTPFNWLALPYKAETPTEITTNSFNWSTVNPYGNAVDLQVFTVPASEVLVTKHVGRIAGYTEQSEVFSPVVYFRSPPADNTYRVTALISSYPSDVHPAPIAIPVKGTGNAMQVTSKGYSDYVYTGKGDASFGNYSTDADTAFVREAPQPSEFTMINGSYLNLGNTLMAGTSEKADYLSLKRDGSDIKFTIKCDGDGQLTLGQIAPAFWYKVFKDGAEYPNWKLAENGAGMVINLGPGEHTYEIRGFP